MKEEVFLFGENKILVGILTEPAERIKYNDLPAIIFLTSGIIHRIGPNRQSVRIARDLAEMGFICFRFDFSGIGDSLSTSNSDRLHLLDKWVRDTQEAIDFLAMKRGIKQIILAGDCSGAFMSIKAASNDPRVVGAILIGLPGERIPKRYFLRLAMLNRKSWLRVIRNKAKFSKIKKMIDFDIRKLFIREKNVSAEMINVAKELRTLIERNIDLLLVYCEWESGWDYFQINLGDEVHE